MKCNYLFLLFVISIFDSCTSEHINKGSELNVEFNETTLNFSDEFNNLEFIPLETNSKNIVRKSQHVDLINKTYYVFSTAPDNCISSYDSLGNLIYVIRENGHGPGEFVYAMDVFIDSCINIYDAGKSAIITYNLNGKHISDKRIGSINRFYLKNNLLITYRTYDLPSQLYNIKTNSKLNIFNIKDNNNPKLVFSDIKCIPKRAGYLKIGQMNLVIKNNNLLYWSFPGYTINSLNLNTLKMESYKKINLGARSISAEFIDKPWKNLRDFSSSFLKQKLYFLMCYYPLIKDIYVFSSIDIYIGINNMFTNELTCFNKMSLFNIKDAPALSFRKERIVIAGTADNNKILFTWDANKFLNYCNKIMMMSSTEDWKMILNSYPGLERTLQKTTEESNPILMVATLK